MALNFPSSPSVNDVYTSGGRSWRWDGTSWLSVTYKGEIGYTGSLGYTGSQGVGFTGSAGGAIVGSTSANTQIVYNDSGIANTSSAFTFDKSTNIVYVHSLKERVFTITDGTTVNLDPSNGGIQLWTLGASRTPGQSNWNEGHSITLMIDDGAAYSINWSTLNVTWLTGGGTAPSLNTTGYTTLTLWKVGTTIYGAKVGG